MYAMQILKQYCPTYNMWKSDYMQTTHEIEIHDKLAHDQCSSILKSNTVHTSYLQKLQMTVFKVS